MQSFCACLPVFQKSRKKLHKSWSGGIVKNLTILCNYSENLVKILTMLCKRGRWCEEEKDWLYGAYGWLEWLKDYMERGNG